MKKAREKAVKVVQRIVSPIEDFLHTESSSGIVLIINALIALILANSPLHHWYHNLIHFPISIGFGSLVIEKGLQHWVNDGLMVIFFFVVGLEIKRELVIGELASPKKAALPMFAALGGMIFPAIFYFVLNPSGVTEPGWGIPMATDIAFAVGILALMSKRTPFALKIFLLALAIVDDLGAVLVIAFFYTEQIARSYLGLAAVGFAIITILKYAGVRKVWVYSIFGLAVWFFILKSGIHATIAGVILGLMTPIKRLFPKQVLPEKFRSVAQEVATGIEGNGGVQLDQYTLQKIDELHMITVEASSPLDRLIHKLHPWMSFFIMPIFALVNAGVHIENIGIEQFFGHSVSLGIILGLVLGKPIGVVLFSWLSVKFRLSDLPKGVHWGHMLAVGCLAGIGFTMALFVSNLALKTPELEMFSKLGILVASCISGILGATLLYIMGEASHNQANDDPLSTQE